MQTLMLTVEYDGTRYAAGRPTPKKKSLNTVLGRIHKLLLPGCSRGHTVILCRKNRPWCSCKRADSQLSDHFFPVAFCSKSSLNQVLPQDIAVLDARQVSERFMQNYSPNTVSGSFVSKPVRLLMFSVRSILYFSPTCRIPCECRKHFLF